jgi:hypothetical protein
MPIQRSADLFQAAAALVVLLIFLTIHLFLVRRALADLSRPDRHVRTWTKQAWAVWIVLAAVVGPLAYFQFGRES